MTSQSLTSDAVAEALRARNGAPWHRFWCALVMDVADAAPPPRRRPSFCGRPSSGDQLRRGQQLLDLVEYRALDVPGRHARHRATVTLILEPERADAHLTFRQANPARPRAARLRPSRSLLRIRRSGRSAKLDRFLARVR